MLTNSNNKSMIQVDATYHDLNTAYWPSIYRHILSFNDLERIFFINDKP